MEAMVAIWKTYFRIINKSTGQPLAGAAAWFPSQPLTVYLLVAITIIWMDTAVELCWPPRHAQATHCHRIIKITKKREWNRYFWLFYRPRDKEGAKVREGERMLHYRHQAKENKKKIEERARNCVPVLRIPSLLCAAQIPPRHWAVVFLV